MLLRFTAANHLSINEPVTVNFLAERAIKDSPDVLVQAPNFRENLLPSLVIYGPNGAGKTSILSALRDFQNHLRRSSKSKSPSDQLQFKPFRLNRAGPSGVTAFSVDCMIDGVRYHYGFEFNRSEYTKEWLYSYPEGYPRTLFVRESGSEISFGKTMRGQNRLIEDLTLPNVLFLSRAASNAHPMLTPIYQYFDSQFEFLWAESSASAIQSQLKEDVLDPRIVEFLARADTGIQDVRIRKPKVSSEAKKQAGDLWRALTSVLPPEIEFPSEPPESRVREITFGHVGKDLDELVYLPLGLESRGTWRLVQLLMKALPILDHGGVLVVDELDASLHTVMAGEFISLFSNPGINKGGGQLLVTIHDTNLLQHPMLRRDQIWFAEKDAWGETLLTPLTDTRTRSTDNLERAYLQGRFGAVPSKPSTSDDWLL